MLKIIASILLLSVFSTTAQSATEKKTPVVKVTPVITKISSVKVLWCTDCTDWGTIDERSNLSTKDDALQITLSKQFGQPYTPIEPSTTIEQMVKNGWNILQIVPTNVKGQFYVVFTK
jgi:hypothetical protein